jgi:hypothetical protein
VAEEDRDEFFELTEKAVFDFLCHPDRSRLHKTDPTGERALAVAAAVRRNMRLLYKSGRMTKAEGLEQVEVLRKKLRQALFKPELLGELLNG